MATTRQKSFIEKLTRERGLPVPNGLDTLPVGDASKVIGTLLATPIPTNVITDDGVNLTDVMSGRYAVEVNGRVQFYKLDNLTSATGRWAGWVFVKAQQGDNFARAGAQRPGQTYRGDHDDAMRLILDNPLAAAKRYGHALGVCAVCGRALTDPTSIAAGIGPVCASRF